MRWLHNVVWVFAATASSIAVHAVDYLVDVKPLLTEHCVGCHGADKAESGLRLDTAAAALKGGMDGPAVVPGRPDESLLVRLVGAHPGDRPRMPYKKAPLTDAQVNILKRWIESGAQVPLAEVPGRKIHWAFVPPVRRSIPLERVAGESARHPIDAWIGARLVAEGLSPAPEADRATLLRRVSLDLTGLPPSPERTAAFVADPRPDAYERVVEELLASPHHGERWGRWWLDVARYADSNGYSADQPRSIWPWRDWVVRSLNADMPFDQFIVEQLAGDLLPEATLDQRIATGFHRNTQLNEEGGIDPEQFRIEGVLDRVNTTGTALLGLTVACAQCHDHKFDPIRQREYFQLFAFFNQQDEPTLELPVAGAVLAKDPGQPSKPAAKPPTTLVLSERPAPRKTTVFIKGDFTRPGEEVGPGTPAVLPAMHALAGGGRGPNRLDLARWLMDPAHPLTARVLVNRVWQQYFGRGLVETENDFGTQGSLPSHPELLDWLAVEFAQPADAARSAYSLKHLHRWIVTSRTYRQSSVQRPDLLEKDPANRLLARQNRLRLDAELVRDVALSASGLLDPVLGGPPVHPPQPDGVMSLGQVRREWRTSAGGDRYRRGLYTYYWRATPHPALAVFDAPDAFSACTRRNRSNTPLQALTLLNDAAFVDFADALGRRIQAEAPVQDRVAFGFRLCTGREPRALERERLERLYEVERRQVGEAGAWQTVARVLLNLDETITRE
ncbi:MAG: PSD1 and planctomycete cytochrome C domain-containing protein [Limisphaerales bacterium]